MARSLSVFFGSRVRAAVARCGFASQGVAGPGSVSREPDPDSDWEPEERELQEVESALKRQKKAMRFQKIRRQMEAPGAPPRTLTWEAMEQIRYLHEEFAESWSVPRLAEGFDVSTDVIRRVLKSKFVPTLEQKLRQDQKVLKKAGITRAVCQLPIAEDTLKPLSAGHSVSGPLLMPGGEVSPKSQNHSPALKVVKSNVHSTDAQKKREERNKRIQVLEESLVPTTSALGHQRDLEKYTTSDSEAARRADNDLVPSVETPEVFKAREPGRQNFSSKVVQRGCEFFDSNGNFLYRI
ncbi:neugrin [Grammomys surdaster]|uniref:neugrin n=1 Tax=Grammomys surdaster TaxID=491861 RepID=UPI0010A03340|nr:neugrin [Grammomys surdaster]